MEPAKILVDMNLSPSWVSYLENAGYIARHWSQIGSPDATDSDIINWAKKEGYIVFTHDLDFGTLLYLTNASFPSVIQLRCEDIRPHSADPLLIQSLRIAQKELERGALVSIDPRKNRVRLLPLKNTEQH